MADPGMSDSWGTFVFSPDFSVLGNGTTAAAVTSLSSLTSPNGSGAQVANQQPTWLENVHATQPVDVLVEELLRSDIELGSLPGKVNDAVPAVHCNVNQCRRLAQRISSAIGGALGKVAGRFTPLAEQPQAMDMGVDKLKRIVITAWVLVLRLGKNHPVQSIMHQEQVWREVKNLNDELLRWATHDAGMPLLFGSEATINEEDRLDRIADDNKLVSQVSQNSEILDILHQIAARTESLIPQRENNKHPLDTLVNVMQDHLSSTNVSSPDYARIQRALNIIEEPLVNEDEFSPHFLQSRPSLPTPPNLTDSRFRHTPPNSDPIEPDFHASMARHANRGSSQSLNTVGINGISATATDISPKVHPRIAASPLSPGGLQSPRSLPQIRGQIPTSTVPTSTIVPGGLPASVGSNNVPSSLSPGAIGSIPPGSISAPPLAPGSLPPGATVVTEAGVSAPISNILLAPSGLPSPSRTNSGGHLGRFDPRKLQYRDAQGSVRVFEPFPAHWIWKAPTSVDRAFLDSNQLVTRDSSLLVVAPWSPNSPALDKAQSPQDRYIPRSELEFLIPMPGSEVKVLAIYEVRGNIWVAAILQGDRPTVGLIPLSVLGLPGQEPAQTSTEIVVPLHELASSVTAYIRHSNAGKYNIVDGLLYRGFIRYVEQGNWRSHLTGKISKLRKAHSSVITTDGQTELARNLPVVCFRDGSSEHELAFSTNDDRDMFYDDLIHLSPNLAPSASRS